MDVFIARRAVFDATLKVFGYRLLHSPCATTGLAARTLDPTLQLINSSLFAFDPVALAGGKKLLYPFTVEALISNCAELLSPDWAIVDVLPSAGRDDDVLMQCCALKSAGFELCIPVASEDDLEKPVSQLATLLSVDLSRCGDPAVLQGIADHAPPGKPLLARWINSTDELHQVEAMGFTHFEGPFFWRPPTVSGADVPGLKANYLRLLRALNEPDPDHAVLADIIAHEASLAYKLLRLVNSVASGLSNPITSIDRAVAMVGERGVRQLALVAAVTELAPDAPVELLVCSSLRARFCQLIGTEIGLGHQASDLFLTGLFSLLDVIAGRSMSQLLDSIQLDGPARAALEGERCTFREILDLVVKYEQGQWSGLSQATRRLGIPPRRLATLYLGAVEWASTLEMETPPEDLNNRLSTGSQAGNSVSAVSRPAAAANSERSNLVVHSAMSSPSGTSVFSAPWRAEARPHSTPLMDRLRRFLS